MKRLAAICLLCLLNVCALAQPFTVNDIAFLGQPPFITDWAQRVVANGGAMPSQNSIVAMDTFRTGIINAGLSNKIYSLCVFVPDSLIAATTPLFKTYGADPWTNVNFSVTNLSIEGLKGDGATKSLDTGVKLKDIQVRANGSAIGFTTIVSESESNRLEYIMGQRDEVGDPLTLLLVSGGGSTEWYGTLTTATENITTNDFARVGYVSGNRWVEGGQTNVAIFVASPLEAHKIIKSKVAALSSATTTSNTVTISCFAYKYANTNTGWSSQRLSLAVIHDGFTQTESSNFWVLAQACRQSLGGGDGDPVHDWARYVTNFGGAAISVNTSNSLRTFRRGLDTDGLLYTIAAANVFVPDDLTSARMPILWQAGNQIWTNTAFGASNLTVNGLTGNGTTKYLGTGINLSALNYGGFSDTSAGLSTLIYNTGSDSNQLVMGATGAAVNGNFSVANQVGLAVFYCWISTTVNTDCLIRTAPNAGWEGYLSGNRTAANAIRLDWVTNQVHNVATNGTGTTASNNNSMTNMFAFAIANNASTPTAFSSQTISFMAVHGGLTQTQSSNLWIRVRDVRNAFGGGVP